MKIKITRREKLLEVHNCYCSNWYYLIHGRIYNDGMTAYKRFRFVAWFDGEELAEADAAPLEYLEDVIFSYTDIIGGFEDCAEFFQACNESIERYNAGLRHAV